MCGEEGYCESDPQFRCISHYITITHTVILEFALKSLQYLHLSAAKCT